jgi:DNA-binding NarL/FixJ family response regulator
MMLESDERFDVAEEVEDGLSAIKSVLKHQPDIIILDLSMPRMNGLAAIKDIKRQSPETRILALTIHEDEEYIVEAFQSGADGYCLKVTTRDDLLKAINIVLSGKTYISPAIANTVLEGYIEGKQTVKKDTTWNTLTKREKEILKLVGEGYTSKEIADYLCISPKTVEKHRSNLMNKLNIHNVSALTAYAIDKGLVSK